MNLVKIENGAVVAYPYTRDDLRRDNPLTSFPLDLSGVDLSGFGAAVVWPSEKPEVTIEEDVVEVAPILSGDKWRQAWQIVSVDDAEIARRVAEKRSNMRVSRRQFKLALDAIGKLELVEAAMNVAPRAVQIHWAESIEHHRTHPLIASFAGQLGFTDAEVDALFEAAAAIP